MPTTKPKQWHHNGINLRSILSEILTGTLIIHGVQRRMISVDNFYVFLRLLFFALLLLYVT